jgi:hypothetical protein
MIKKLLKKQWPKLNEIKCWGIKLKKDKSRKW